MKKITKTTAVAVKSTKTSERNPSIRDAFDKDPVKAVSQQYERTCNAVNASVKEMVLFGAMLEGVDKRLTENDAKRRARLDRRGGNSLKGWLATNCPEVNYETARAYYQAARATRDLIKLSSDVPLLALMGEQTVPDAKLAKYQQKIVKLMSTASLNMLRRSLRGPGGATKGQKLEAPNRRALTPEERSAEAAKMAHELASSIGAYLDGDWLQLLTDDQRTTFANALKDYGKRIADFQPKTVKEAN